jgi:hypothetical protein
LIQGEIVVRRRERMRGLSILVARLKSGHP